MPRLLVSALVVALLIAVAGERPSAQFRKGFTQQKIEVKLNRRRPPKVYLMNTVIRVDGVGQSGQFSQAASRIATMLEAELTSHDPRLRPDKNAPETVITTTVARLDGSRSNVSRQVTVTKQTGTKQEYNEKSKKYEDKAVYGQVQETHHFVVVKGGISVALQVRDTKSGAILDAETISPTYDQEFRDGNGAPDDAGVEQQLIERVVNTIVPRLTPTREMVEIMLARPNDQIDQLNKLGQAGLWARMGEQLELMKPLTDLKKEAYRLYNLGVTSEALAYDTEDVQVSKKLLEQASSYYNKALEAKPDEEYFRQPQTRIQEAITAYAKLDSQQATYARTLADAAALKEATLARAATEAAEGARNLTAAGPKAMTNQDVIDLVGAGIDHPNLLASIKEAVATDFNLNPDGLKALLVGKVPNPVITAMRARQTGGAAPAPAAARRPAARAAAPAAGAAKPTAPAAAATKTAAPAAPSTTKPATK